ncbi:circularly permuted type 2 ATP-grasp protein [Amaricoccus solimangrovi]|uniref:Uncharacterized protein n=1 Tax=Amaricoccus solimangrovi TaxID=2589815 RepID=A0A501X0G7_9RHOB|nr:circularly permuted type 2 ATP-grasp protein [Amaricoccus solimangrovi]TPE53171.1 hypothetical protein FJM51_03875 [Amaricoccus solimangrovi]
MRPRDGLAAQDAIARLLADYHPLPGVADELLDQTGRIRPVWERFMAHLAALPPEELSARFARGDQYLRDAGVFFRQYGDDNSSERAWPLSHIPVLIDEAEWNTVAEGLIQRADLLEAVVADLYGPNRLVGTGQLPATLVGRSPEWLRPLVGVPPRSGHHLHFLAFELGRGPDGTWWVLGDRAQAPSGAGFALENRMATARVFAELYAEANAHRLAGFFRTFRDALHGLCEDHREPRVAILTPGPLNDTYFEHAYIARYLGFMLLEGEDLTVEKGHVMVRTVGGLMPIDVLWRRLDAAFADPLELNSGSRIGTPGLVGAVRRGNVSLVNALGSGILETRALLAFLPRISMALRGEPLRIPNIATWWCGQPVERAHVRANAARMMIGSALSTRLPFDLDSATGIGGQGRGPEEIDAWIESEGPALVGQEAVTLSTTPAHVDGRLVPRPMSLRAFLVRTARGWEVMPGGFARIGRTPDPTAIAMQRGGSAADVWILGPGPTQSVTMLPEPSVAQPRLKQGALPSRAGDNLFWLGRYIERAEGMMRLLRAHHIRLAETGDPDAPLLTYLDRHLGDVGLDPGQEIPDGLRATLSAATSSAGQVRDRFSTDGWMALNDLSRTARRMAGTARAGDDCARAMGVLLRKITGFSGLVHENMYRFTGWRFLVIGRAMERSMEMAGLLAWLGAPDAPDGALDLAIEIGDSVMTHRRRYAAATTRETVIDLLALDGMNPRAILYQMGEVRNQVALLPGADVNGQLSRLSREVMRLHTDVATQLPEGLDTDALLDLRDRLFDLSGLLSETYLG